MDFLRYWVDVGTPSFQAPRHKLCVFIMLVSRIFSDGSGVEIWTPGLPGLTQVFGVRCVAKSTFQRCRISVDFSVNVYGFVWPWPSGLI